MTTYQGVPSGWHQRSQARNSAAAAAQEEAGHLYPQAQDRQRLRQIRDRRQDPPYDPRRGVDHPAAGTAGTLEAKHEIRSTKSETSSKDEKESNDPNGSRFEHVLIMILDSFRISCFPISNFLLHCHSPDRVVHKAVLAHVLRRVEVPAVEDH